MGNYDEDYERVFSPSPGQPIQLPVKRLSITLVAMLFWLALHYIPLPIIDISLLTGGSSSFVPQISIMALGIWPVLTVGVIFEIVGLLFPKAARTQVYNRGHVNVFNAVVVVSALVLVVIQGSGIISAMAAIQYDLTDDLLGQAAILASLAAGTIVALLIAQFINRYGIGHGFWVVYAGFTLLEVPNKFNAVASAARAGALSSNFVIFEIALALAAIALIAHIGRLTLRGTACEPEDLLWPLMSAHIAGSLLASIVVAMFRDSAFGNSAIVVVVVSMALTLLFVGLSLRGRMPFAMIALTSAALAVVPQLWTVRWLSEANFLGWFIEFSTNTPSIALILVLSGLAMTYTPRNG